MRKKYCFSIITFLFIGGILCAQEKNEITIYYGISDNRLVLDQDIVGTGTYENKGLKEFGLRYIRQISRILYAETGLNFSSVDVLNTPLINGEPFLSVAWENLKLISIPLYLRYRIGPHFYLNGGPFLDFQTSENLNLSSQSGLGYFLGIGGKLNIDNFSIFINPNYKRHAILQSDNFYNLTEFGIQFGVGYRF